MSLPLKSYFKNNELSFLDRLPQSPIIITVGKLCIILVGDIFSKGKSYNKEGANKELLKSAKKIS